MMKCEEKLYFLYCYEELRINREKFSLFHARSGLTGVYKCFVWKLYEKKILLKEGRGKLIFSYIYNIHSHYKH